MKVYDRVILVSKGYFQSDSNPYYDVYKVVGTITQITDDNFPLKVSWDNGKENCYKHGELKKNHLLGDLIDFVNKNLTV